jgi:hypothetical protein
LAGIQNPSLVVPGILLGIHASAVQLVKDVDGRNIRAFTPVFYGLCPAMRLH